jgi:hypothetical protein
MDILVQKREIVNAVKKVVMGEILTEGVRNEQLP